MIVFKNVTKRYNSNGMLANAVDNVSLSVDEGKICVLLGPSGCGKTTLLRMVNKLISLSEGSIEVDGQDVTALNPIELRRSIGYVIQQNGLFPNMVIEDNICVVPKLLRWDKARMKKRTEELMELLGLNYEKFRKRYPWELSGGQQQRVGIARAMAADPPIMLMDEPFGALDPVIRQHIQNEFLRIQQTIKKTILFVSHDIDEAIKLGDTIAIFNSGQLMQHAAPDTILSNPANDFVKNFIGIDGAIKRLTLFSVKDLIKIIGGDFNRRTVSDQLFNAGILLETDLRNALSILLSSPTGEAVVSDHTGHVQGVIRVSDFDSITAVHPTELRSIIQ